MSWPLLIKRRHVDAQADVKHVYTIAYGEWKQWPADFPARKAIPKHVIDVCKKLLQREKLIFFRELDPTVVKSDNTSKVIRKLQNQCMVEAERRLENGDWDWFLWISKYGDLISMIEKRLDEPVARQLGQFIYDKWKVVTRLAGQRREVGERKRKQVLEEGRIDVASDRHIRRIKAEASGVNKGATKKKVLMTAAKKRARKKTR